MSDDDKRYQTWREEQEAKWESLCGRCGACCGSIEGDPCEHLRQGKNSKYYCDIYATRFGRRKTISGRVFNCVPIRSILHKSWPGDECCGYKQNAT